MKTFFYLVALAFAPFGRGVEVAKPEVHQECNIEGWTVRVDVRLLAAPNEELGRRAMKLLEARLTDIVAVVAPGPLAELRKVPIVLDLTHGELTSMQYHGDVGWVVGHGYARQLAKCVHIPEVARFVWARHQHIQPWCVLHELAHAYHDQVLGFSDPRIRAAWEHYVASGHGASVLRIDSEKRVPHYALTNEKEFFAEMSEAYFGVNDFFPFTNAELKEAEPEAYALMYEIWGAVP